MLQIEKKSNDPLMGRNHLTIVRWVLASLVLLGHSWLLTTGYEPFRIHQWTGSYMAVNGFFILSGLLIAKSLHMRNDLKAYTVSRLLRIYPALIVLLLAFVFVFSPLFSESSGFTNILDGSNWKYMFRVLLLGDPEGAPGGVFSTNPEADFNGPLWTIRFELMAYIMAAVAFSIGAIKSFKSSLALFILMQIAYIAIVYMGDSLVLPPSIKPLFRLSSAFLMGVVLWQWPAGRRPHLAIALIFCALFAFFGASLLGELIANIALAAILLRVGLPKISINAVVKIPDFSYGIYIWHYPIMQAIIFIGLAAEPVSLLLISTPLILLVSGLSWYVIEKPALKLKRFALTSASKQANKLSNQIT